MSSQATDTGATPSSWLTRRELALKLVCGLVGGMASSQVVQAHPIHKHLSDATTWSLAQAQAEAVPWVPQFLETKQNETLIVLAERMIPGASKARVNQFIDLLLSVEARENQQKFVDSLSALDRGCHHRFGHSFKELNAVQQDQALTTFAAETAHDGDKGGSPIPTRGEADLEAPIPHNHFENLKAWIVGAYYSSEVGMRELGWAQQFAFNSFPGCPHPEGHH
jgi:hypothetical protein